MRGVPGLKPWGEQAPTLHSGPYEGLEPFSHQGFWGEAPRERAEPGEAPLSDIWVLVGPPSLRVCSAGGPITGCSSCPCGE